VFTVLFCLFNVESSSKRIKWKHTLKLFTNIMFILLGKLLHQIYQYCVYHALHVIRSSTMCRPCRKQADFSTLFTAWFLGYHSAFQATWSLNCMCI